MRLPGAPGPCRGRFFAMFRCLPRILPAARKPFLTLSLAFLALGPPASAGAARVLPDSGCIRGVTLSLFHPEDRSQVDSSLDRIVALHATHVCLLYALSQRNVESDSILVDPELAPPDSLVLSVAARAHSRGLRVVLFPLLYLRDTAPGLWRGTLAPASWTRWFRGYGERMRDCGRLAERSHAEWLCIGAELVTSERHSRDWGRVIRGVRRVYSGKIFYSQNWDHLEVPGFAGQLDRMGMNAYFELSRETRPTPGTLRRAWGRLSKSLRRSRGNGAEWIFTEVGYPGSAGAAGKPWDYLGEGVEDWTLQRDCLDAFFRTWRGAPEIRGTILYWWSCKEGGEGTRYSFRNRPAEETVRHWFGRGFPCVRNP